MHTQTLNKIWSEIRDNDELAFLDRQTYPEWDTANPNSPFPNRAHWIPSDEKIFRKAFYICNQVVQLMESVYHDLKFEQKQEREHPDNSGWMNFFRHWSSSGMFRVTWAISGCTYGAGFQHFCMRQLGLKADHFPQVVTFSQGYGNLNPVEERIHRAINPTGSYDVKVLLIQIRHRLDNQQHLTLHAGFALFDGSTLRYIRI